ncbi:MAG: major capsid protein [Alistipes sp.]
MSDRVTKKMLAAYIQNSMTPTAFFTGMFQARPENFHETEEVEIDIQRVGEDVAIVVQDITTGYRLNSDDLYTNKGFKPPIFKEAFALNAFDLLKREAGQNPFASAGFRQNLIARIARNGVKVVNKILRAVELQAAQVMQTGKVDLKNESGAILYTIDYKPKATHFPTVATIWSNAGAKPMSDINAVAEVIRTDGLTDPDMLIFGVNAWMNFSNNADVQKTLDLRRMEGNSIVAMQRLGNGGIYRGTVEIGNYKYDCYTYAGRYKDPQTGSSVQYMDPGKVVVMSSGARLDLTFGAIPNIGEAMGTSQRAQLLPELPGRISSGAAGFDVFTTAWTTNDGEQMFGGFGARPLAIPTAIDSFGCLTTGL